MRKQLQQFLQARTLSVLKAAAAGTKEASTWAQVQLDGGAHTLLYVATVPAVLIIAFTYLYFFKKGRKLSQDKKIKVKR